MIPISFKLGKKDFHLSYWISVKRIIKNSSFSSKAIFVPPLLPFLYKVKPLVVADLRNKNYNI
jgi:hypothetical protein